MKYGAVKRQLLEDQVETAKSLLANTAEIERNGELDFNPYLKSELSHLQKYVDQLNIKPKSPFGIYRRTEQEDLSYCLHRKHSKSMSTLSELIKNINKELYRLKKLKQAEKKLEFLALFQSRELEQSEEYGQHVPHNSKIHFSPKINQYKLPESKSAFIPQLASPKPKYQPDSLPTEEEEKPEMSRAMEGFLKQQEKELKLQQQKEIKPNASFVSIVSSSDNKEKESEKKNSPQQDFSSAFLPNSSSLKENPMTNYDDSKAVHSTKEKKSTNSSQQNKTISFSGLRQPGPALKYTSSDPERPYGAYSNENHYVSTLGRSSGTTLENQTKSVEEKSRGAYY